MANQHVYFSTGTSPRTAYFSVTSARKHVRFVTGVRLNVAHFSVVANGRHVLFSTGRAPQVAYFTCDTPPDGLLVAELSPNHRFLNVTLSPALKQGPYQLHVFMEGQAREIKPMVRAVPGAFAWSFPVPEDGVFYLTVTAGPNAVVAQSVAMVNYSALRALAQYRKRQGCACPETLFEDLCHYNGLAILLYETGQFTACQQMLTLLKDLCLCPC